PPSDKHESYESPEVTLAKAKSLPKPKTASSPPSAAKTTANTNSSSSFSSNNKNHAKKSLDSAAANHHLAFNKLDHESSTASIKDPYNPNTTTTTPQSSLSPTSPTTTATMPFSINNVSKIKSSNEQQQQEQLQAAALPLGNSLKTINAQTLQKPQITQNPPLSQHHHHRPLKPLTPSRLKSENKLNNFATANSNDGKKVNFCIPEKETALKLNRGRNNSWISPSASASASSSTSSSMEENNVKEEETPSGGGQQNPLASHSMLVRRSPGAAYPGKLLNKNIVFNGTYPIDMPLQNRFKNYDPEANCGIDENQLYEATYHQDASSNDEEYDDEDEEEEEYDENNFYEDEDDNGYLEYKQQQQLHDLESLNSHYHLHHRHQKHKQLLSSYGIIKAPTSSSSSSSMAKLSQKPAHQVWSMQELINDPSIPLNYKKMCNEVEQSLQQFEKYIDAKTAKGGGGGGGEVTTTDKNMKTSFKSSHIPPPVPPSDKHESYESPEVTLAKAKSLPKPKTASSPPSAAKTTANTNSSSSFSSNNKNHAKKSLDSAAANHHLAFNKLDYESSTASIKDPYNPNTTTTTPQSSLSPTSPTTTTTMPFSINNVSKIKSSNEQQQQEQLQAAALPLGNSLKTINAQTLQKPQITQNPPLSQHHHHRPLKPLTPSRLKSENKLNNFATANSNDGKKVNFCIPEKETALKLNRGRNNSWISPSASASASSSTSSSMEDNNVREEETPSGGGQQNPLALNKNPLASHSMLVRRSPGHAYPGKLLNKNIVFNGTYPIDMPLQNRFKNYDPEANCGIDENQLYEATYQDASSNDGEYEDEEEEYDENNYYDEEDDNGYFEYKQQQQQLHDLESLNSHYHLHHRHQKHKQLLSSYGIIKAPTTSSSSSSMAKLSQKPAHQVWSMQELINDPSIPLNYKKMCNEVEQSLQQFEKYIDAKTAKGGGGGGGEVTTTDKNMKTSFKSSHIPPPVVKTFNIDDPIIDFKKNN
uniref:Uncharacterized protein n=1 Tax=Musca domestica TaxID=7370 RepID=A0A1I8NIX3_MUSDO